MKYWRSTSVSPPSKVITKQILLGSRTLNIIDSDNTVTANVADETVPPRFARTGYCRSDVTVSRTLSHRLSDGGMQRCGRRSGYRCVHFYDRRQGRQQGKRSKRDKGVRSRSDRCVRCVWDERVGRLRGARRLPVCKRCLLSVCHRGVLHMLRMLYILYVLCELRERTGIEQGAQEGLI